MGRYDILQEVTGKGRIRKFNPNHDNLGRFSSAGGGGGYQKLSHADAITMAHEMGQDKMSAEDVNQMLDRDHGYFGTGNSFIINEDLRDSAQPRSDLMRAIFGDEPIMTDDESLKTVDALDRNMKPSTRDVQLIRMIGDSFFDSMGINKGALYEGEEKGTEEMQKMVGKVYTNAGYTSTSFNVDDNVFISREVQLNINAPKGTQMLVSPARRYGEVREAEILLARGSTMKITAIRPIYKTEYGTTYLKKLEVDCEVLVD